MNRICLCLNGSSLSESLAMLKAETHFDPAQDLAELRLDFLLDFFAAAQPEQNLAQLCQELAASFANLGSWGGKPPQLILTLRKCAEGGRCPDTLPAACYIRILLCCAEAIPPASLAYIDIDQTLLAQLPSPFWQLLRQKQTGLIVSAHDFGPFASADKLGQRAQKLDHSLSQLEAQHKPPSNYVLKFALMVRSSAELAEFYRLAVELRRRSRRYVLLAMGEFGSSSRILSATIGSLWSFCSPGAGQTDTHTDTVAPGQLRLAELVQRYHYRHLHRKTQIYGVIGNPIAHSRSPEIHNPIYRQKGWDAVYLPFRVDELESFWQLTEYLPIRGLSVTLPHKEQLAAALRRGQLAGTAAQASQAVQLLGACNTLYLCQSEDGPYWRGENTDVDGFVLPLLKLAQQHHIDLSGKRAAIIGAGGAARAAVYALLRQGVDCQIYNRSPERAQRLAELFCQAPSSDSPSGRGRILHAGPLAEGQNISPGCDLVVQTTSVGLASGSSGCFDPLPAYRFRPGQIAYDLIYQTTPFLQRAKDAGAIVLNGYAMLEQQARRQIALFEAARDP